MKIAKVLLIVVFLVMSGNVARAVPFESYFYDCTQNIGMFDRLEMYMIEGAFFQGIEIIDPTTWKSFENTSRYIAVYGPQTYGLSFLLKFTTEHNFTFHAYNISGEQLQGYTIMTHADSGWTSTWYPSSDDVLAQYQQDQELVDSPTPVPEPASMLLVGVGIAGMVVMRRKNFLTPQTV